MTDLPDDLPPGFTLARATDGERVVGEDGTEYRVLVDPADGPQLVHADIVEYDRFHPLVSGLLGFYIVLVGFLGPIAGGYYLATTATGLVPLVAIVGGVIGGWVLANVLLYRTRFGEWLFRFLEWNDHRSLLLARGDGL